MLALFYLENIDENSTKGSEIMCAKAFLGFMGIACVVLVVACILAMPHVVGALAILTLVFAGLSGVINFIVVLINLKDEMRY